MTGETAAAIELLENRSHTTDDGVELVADIYRPTAPGRYPTLLMRTPYNKTLAQLNNYAPPEWFARQGYAVVVEDVRGRGRSGGEFYPFATEASDGEQSVAWASELSFSNGRVGMYGLSYPGVTQMQAARSGTAPLTSIAPAMTSADYHQGWTYRGGALELSFATSWARMLAKGDALKAGDAVAYSALARSYGAGDYNDLPLSATQPLADLGVARYFFDWLSHPDRDEYWTRWALHDSYATMTVPGLHIGGWWDIFLEGTFQNFAGMRATGRAQQRCVVGPWTHAIDESQLHCPKLTGIIPNPLDDLMAAWFDHTLRGATDTLPDAAVRLYVVRGDRWLSTNDWPPNNLEQQTWFLASGGKANADRGDGRLLLDGAAAGPPDTYVYDPLSPVPSIGGASCCSNEVSPMGPADQSAIECLSSVLIYTSPPFDATRVVVGEVGVVLHAATSGVDTDFVCRLCVVDRAGRSINISDGILRGRYREGLDKQVPTMPSEIVEYTIALQPVTVQVAAGERLRLQVTSSAFPRWDRNLNTGAANADDGPAAAVVVRQHVFHDAQNPSRLVVNLLPA